MKPKALMVSKAEVLFPKAMRSRKVLIYVPSLENTWSSNLDLRHLYIRDKIVGPSHIWKEALFLGAS